MSPVLLIINLPIYFIMKKISKFVFAVLIFSLILPISVFAEGLGKIEPVSTQAVLLADVNIKEAKIIAQDGNNIKIRFSILNNEDAQSGLMYGVKLYSLDKEGNILSIVDEKKYDEIFSLSANGTFEREIEYEAPTALSGNFEIFLSIKNKADFLFSINPIAKINLKSSSGIQLVNESCKIFVNKNTGQPLLEPRIKRGRSSPTHM